MTTKNRFTAQLALGALLLLPVLTNGCDGDDPLSAACCTDFKVGADLSGADFGVDASIKGEFLAFAQAAADLSATATAALEEVSGACKAIATAGGANEDKIDEGEKKKPDERVTFWCNLATARINATVKAQGALTVVVQAPKCEASVSAAANCQANCTVDASCDVKATPPTCEGGRMEVSCKGTCNVEASAPTISCEGTCSGQCSGSCSAQGGVAVDCDGQCEGTCSASGGGGGGGGIQADGSCKGKCDGTCTMRADAKISCSGTCNGSCDASCTAAPGTASARCDGKCEGEFEPISCKGGELKAACQMDAKCEANCNASVQAKAECTPPRVDVTFTGSMNAEVGLVLDALRLNLPTVFLVAESRGKAFLDLIAKVSGSAQSVVDPGKLGVKGTACLGAIVPVMVAASANMSAAFNASVGVAGAVK